MTYLEDRNARECVGQLLGDLDDRCTARDDLIVDVLLSPWREPDHPQRWRVQIMPSPDEDAWITTFAATLAEAVDLALDELARQ